MNNFLQAISTTFRTDLIIQLCILAIVADTIFGVIRAIKERKFNSCIGIDGAVRKITMIVSLLFLVIVDFITHFNLLGFIPKDVATYLNLTVVGIADFFGLLYIAYEVVSILKNMTLCGANTKGVYKWVRQLLSKYTTELPDEN